MESSNFPLSTGSYKEHLFTILFIYKGYNILLYLLAPWTVKSQ